VDPRLGLRVAERLAVKASCLDLNCRGERLLPTAEAGAKRRPGPRGKIRVQWYRANGPVGKGAQESLEPSLTRACVCPDHRPCLGWPQTRHTAITNDSWKLRFSPLMPWILPLPEVLFNESADGTHDSLHEPGNVGGDRRAWGCQIRPRDNSGVVFLIASALGPSPLRCRAFLRIHFITPRAYGGQNTGKTLSR